MPTGTVNIELPEAYHPLFRPARYKVIKGGRGSAKSHSFARALLIKSLERPMRILCCREIKDSIDASVKQLFEDIIERYGLWSRFDRQRDKIFGRNGSTFMFRGLKHKPESLKSMEALDIVYVAEANYVSQVSWDYLTPTLRVETPEWSSEIWAEWNPRFETDPVDTMFFGGDPPPNTYRATVSWRDNPWFPNSLRDEMEWVKRRDPDKWRNIWEGEYVIRSDQQVFRNWRTDAIDERLAAADAAPLLGSDWGFSIDPTVLVEVYALPPRTLYVRREVAKVGAAIDEIPSLFAGYDRRVPARWPNPWGHPGLESVRKGGRIVGDSQRPDTIVYLKARGLNIVKARKGPGSIEDGVEFINSHDTIIHPDCKGTIDEFIHYSFKLDPHTDLVTAELEDRHNHRVDSVRYAVESLRRKAGIRGRVVAPRVIPLEG